MPPSIDKTNKGLYELLHGDSALLTLAPGDVWDSKADDGTALPFVVFQRVTGVPDHVMGGAVSSEKQVYMVKGYAEDKAVLATIVDRFKIVLNNATLAIEGSNTLACLLGSDIPPTFDDAARTGRTTDTWSEGCYVEITAA